MRVIGNAADDSDDSVLRALFYVSIFAAIYGCLSFSKSKLAFPIALTVFGALEIVRLVRIRRESLLETACEASFFLVLFSVFLGVYRHAFASDRIFMFATAFYRPYFTLRCNRRLALIFCLLIVTVVLPIVFAIVTDPSYVRLLTIGYACLVASLWIFCSRLGSDLFG